MPDIMKAAPARLLDLPGFIFDSTDEGITGKTAVKPCTLTVDMEHVLYVREDTDEPSRCIVDQQGGNGFTVAMERDEFAALWRAYREHADALGRLRN